MAQKRMIDKKISVSEQVSNLGTQGALFFTWMIPHADDIGLLPSSLKTLKAMIVPMFDEYTVENIGIQLENMRKTGLIENVTFKEKTYLRIINFSTSQYLKKDRNPQTYLPIEFKGNKKEDVKRHWEHLESIWKPTGKHLDTEWKGNEMNGIEMNRMEMKRNEPKVKERKLEGKPIIPSGSKSDDFEIFDNPEDRKDKETSEMYERLKNASKHLIVLLAFFLLFKPVLAETVIIRHTISSPLIKPSSSQKLEPKKGSPSSADNKKTQEKIGSTATALTPIPKLLTVQGAKNREWVLNYVDPYYTDEELVAYDNLMKKEAGYELKMNEYGCGGFPQACPFEKMGCKLEDLACQAQWSIGYLNSRYGGSPIEAWKFWLARVPVDGRDVGNWY